MRRRKRNPSSSSLRNKSLSKNSVYRQDFEWFMKHFDVPDSAYARAYHKANVGTDGAHERLNWMLELCAMGNGAESALAPELEVSQEWLDQVQESENRYNTDSNNSQDRSL